MTLRVRFAPDAGVDLERLEAFLADKSPDAAVKAAALIVAGARSLKAHPHRGRPVGMDGRRELVRRFGRSAYVIRYVVEGDEVLILRIFHAREER